MNRRKVVGYKKDGSPARIQSEVAYFSDEKGYFKITNTRKGIRLVTPKGVYLFKKHQSLNIHQATCGGHKTHISLKKIVGEIRWW